LLENREILANKTRRKKKTIKMFVLAHQISINFFLSLIPFFHDLAKAIEVK